MRLHLVVILLSLDPQAKAFQITVGARSRAASGSRTTLSPPPRSASPVQGYGRPEGAVVARTSVLHLATGGAPEEGSREGGAPTKVPEKATASSTAGKDVDGAEVKDSVGHAAKVMVKEDPGEDAAGGVKGGGDSATVKAVVSKTPPPVVVASSAPVKEKMVDESEFTELEKAFAEARRRSIEQGVAAKATATKKAPPAAADTAADAPAAPKPKAATPSKPSASKPAPATSTSATAVSEPATDKPGASAASPAEQPRVPATPKVVASSPEPKTSIPPEKPTVESREPVPIKPPVTTTPKAVAPSPAPKKSIPPEKPAVESRKPISVKAKESKPGAVEKAPTGAFSLAAESLEEFFGLTKKPRLVSTTTPPAKSSGSSREDPSAMAKLDKAAVDSMLEENGLNEVTLKEDFRQMEAEAKAAQGSGKKSQAEGTATAKPPAEKSATPANPFGALVAIFNPPAPANVKGSPAPAPESASKANEAARPRVTVVPPAIEPEPEPEPERQQKVAAGDGGLRGIFSGMFAEPVYDDEVDTLPQKGSGAPRAMPVFAPPPSPAKAPVKAKEEKKEKSDAPGSSSPSLPFLDGLFGGVKKVDAPKPKSPAPVPARARARAPVQAKAEAPARAVVKEKPPAASLFDELFGGGKGEVKTTTKKEAVSPVPDAKTPPPAPALSKAPTLFNFFGASSEKEKASPPAPTPAAPAPVPIASKKSKPSSAGGMFDFLAGVSTSTKKSGAQTSAPPPPQQQQKQQKQQSAKPSGANPFAGLFGGAGGITTSEKTKTAAASAVAKPKPKRQPLPPPPAVPAPMVSRVKTMDDAFLRKVSIMLKRNQTKIKTFQQLTDRFRGGLITAPVYYRGVEDLFGEENVEEIIGPLLAALPEKDKGKALQMVYSKAQRARSVSQGSAVQSQGGGLTGGLAGLLGGWGAKSKPSSPLASVDSKKEASALAGTGKVKAGATAADPYAFAASKLKDADYQVFKTRTALFARGGINARNYYDTLEKLFGKKGVPQQLQAVLKALPQNKRKLLQDVCDALNKQP